MCPSCSRSPPRVSEGFLGSFTGGRAEGLAGVPAPRVVVLCAGVHGAGWASAPSSSEGAAGWPFVSWRQDSAVCCRQLFVAPYGFCVSALPDGICPGRTGGAGPLPHTHSLPGLLLPLFCLVKNFT